MSAPDEVIHQSMRLRIMSSLSALPNEADLEFTQLRALLRATQGNLGAHLETLEEAGYIKIKKDAVGKRPRTRVSMTASCRKSNLSADHLASPEKFISEESDWLTRHPRR